MPGTGGSVYRLTQSAKSPFVFQLNPFGCTIHGIFAHFNPQPDDPSLRLPEVIKGDDKELRAQ